MKDALDQAAAAAPDRGGRRPGRLPDLVVGPEFFEPLPAEELEAWGALGGEERPGRRRPAG